MNDFQKESPILISEYPLLSHLQMGAANTESSAIPAIIFDIDSWFQANSMGTAVFIIPRVCAEHDPNRGAHGLDFTC